MEFLGHQISQEGILPLQNITELRRFMGMAYQMAKFNQDLAVASAPLRSLLSTKNPWLWTVEHENFFQEVKNVILSPKTLKLYVKLPTKIRVMVAN